MNATVLQGKPTAEGKPGKFKHFTIHDLRVGTVKARNLRYFQEAVPPDPKKAGDTGKPQKEATLEEATILGLEVRGIDVLKDFSKMTGKVTVNDSIDIKKLRLAIGDAGKDQIVTTLSTSLHGEKSTEPGLAGRELSAELFGRKGAKIQIGTVKEITGDFAGFGAQAAFSTGQVTMSPIEFDGVANKLHIKEVTLNGLALTAPNYDDGKGTTVKLKTGNVTKVTIKDVTASFGEYTDPDGKKGEGLKNLTIEGLVFAFIDGKG